MTQMHSTARQDAGQQARTYLMCPPEHFAVDYVINPWMNPAVPVDPARDGRHVVLPAQATGLASQIEAAGFEPVPVDLCELLKAGGGPKCCTLELRH